jgi:hypothetical protein
MHEVLYIRADTATRACHHSTQITITIWRCGSKYASPVHVPLSILPTWDSIETVQGQSAACFGKDGQMACFI